MKTDTLYRHSGLSSALLTLLIIAALTLLPQTAVEASSPRVELFGVELQGATRDTLRKALKDNGMRAEREDDNFWVDLYNARGVLNEASEFKVGYVDADNSFAYAQYTFPSSMDTGQVQRIINLVSTRYGSPSSQSGRTNLGRVSATWNLDGGMRIVVNRGWPNTTTYLQYIDVDANRRMQEEIEAMRRAREREEAEAQGGAF